MAEQTTDLGPEDAAPIERCTDDVDVRSILSAMAILVGIVAVVSVMLIGFFNRLAGSRVPSRTAPLFVAEEQPSIRADQARLEGIDPRQPERSGVPGWPSLGPAQARQEEQTLSQYGWVDKEKGIARVPIERAMELVVDKLPAKTPDK